MEYLCNVVLAYCDVIYILVADNNDSFLKAW